VSFEAEDPLPFILINELIKKKEKRQRTLLGLKKKRR